MILGGWSIWWQARPELTPASEQQWLSVPGGHLWAAQHHDAQGTRWTSVEGPADASIAWTYLAEGGLVGGPIVAVNGNIYLTTASNDLIALDDSGQLIWQSDLPEIPVGWPALGPGGEIYVADVKGGLSSFDTDGNILWRFSPQQGREATSGLIVDSDGTIYYTRFDSIQAIKPDGEALWLARVKDVYLDKPPVLSAGEAYIFLDESAMASSNGAKLALRGLPLEDLKFSLPAFFTGANLKSYLRTGHEVYGWLLTEDGVKIDPVITWNFENQVVVPPYDQGATPGGNVWLFYSGEFFDTRLVWLDKNSKVLNNIRPADRQSNLIAIDRQSCAYVCSDNFNVNANCKVYELDLEVPCWELELGNGVNILGGALVPGRFYISTDTGLLYAIGSGDAPVDIESQTRSTQVTMSGTQTSGSTQTVPTTAPTSTLDSVTKDVTPTLTPDVDNPVGYTLFMPFVIR